MFNIDTTHYYPQNVKYDQMRFMRYDQENQMYDILDSQFIRDLDHKLEITGKKNVTTEAERPSLLSENIYGYFNTQYWWILMEINDLTSPMDLTSDLIINYPKITDLDKIFSTLNAKFN